MPLDKYALAGIADLKERFDALPANPTHKEIWSLWTTCMFFLNKTNGVDLQPNHEQIRLVTTVMCELGIENQRLAKRS